MLTQANDVRMSYWTRVSDDLALLQQRAEQRVRWCMSLDRSLWKVKKVKWAEDKLALIINYLIIYIQSLDKLISCLNALPTIVSVVIICLERP